MKLQSASHGDGPTGSDRLVKPGRESERHLDLDVEHHRPVAAERPFKVAGQRSAFLRYFSINELKVVQVDMAGVVIHGHLESSPCTEDTIQRQANITKYTFSGRSSP
jgi:hypothetical protein